MRLQTRPTLRIPKEDLTMNPVLLPYSRAEVAPLRRSRLNLSEPAEPKGRPDVGPVTSFALGPESSGQAVGRALPPSLLQLSDLCGRPWVDA